ncbi:MAG: alpha/beta fold hydrolase [Streptosporangiaceae bacterium]
MSFLDLLGMSPQPAATADALQLLLLVVLDNAGSEEQVRPLLPGDGASRALITARRPLAGLEGVRRLVLGPLSRLVSRPSWVAADLAARLADEEHRLDQFKAGDLKIATAFAMSYEQLPDTARRVFRRLAVVPGRDFDAALAAVAGEVPVEVAWDALDELVDLGLLHDSAAARCWFHDLVRLFARTRLEEEESPAEREALTARVTSWLTCVRRDRHQGLSRQGQERPMAIKNIVLVHGNFVDGSGWQGVCEHLTADGYRVAIVQNPTLSLDGDVAATRQALDSLDGPAVLVGHSYGGVVIAEAGHHPNVAARAYIAAFAPDTGESVSSLPHDPACRPARHGRARQGGRHRDARQPRRVRLASGCRGRRDQPGGPGRAADGTGVSWPASPALPS